MSEQAMPAPGVITPSATTDEWDAEQGIGAREPDTGGRRARAIRRRREAVNISEPERLASAVAGGVLAIYGVRRKGWGGLGLAALGVELLRRGMTGHCMAYDALGISTKDGELHLTERRSADVDADKAVKARAVEVIGRPRAELYRLWRDFSVLPRFMENLQRVDVLSPTRSHWVTAGPAGTCVEWDAEIIAERENEYIEWQSVKPAEVPNRGTVQFVDAPSSGGTEVIVTLEVQPPAGKVGDLVARAFGKSPQQEVTQALRRFRQMTEGGASFVSDASAARRVDGGDGIDRGMGRGTGRSSITTSGGTSGGRMTDGSAGAGVAF